MVTCALVFSALVLCGFVFGVLPDIQRRQRGKIIVLVAFLIPAILFLLFMMAIACGRLP